MRPGDPDPRPIPVRLPAPSPAREPSNGALEFVDADYVWWRVSERAARRDPGARGDRCLIFASADALRRVWDYPAA